MVRSVEQIAQEMAALDQTVATLSQAFYAAYQKYLAALGSAMQQQLVVAGYHVCTRGYPEQFLKLSLTQRQDLQQSLRKLGKQAEADLIACLKPIEPELPTTAEAQSDETASESNALSDLKISLANAEEGLELTDSTFFELSSSLEAGSETVLLPSDLVLEMRLSDYPEGQASETAEMAEEISSAEMGNSQADSNVDQVDSAQSDPGGSSPEPFASETAESADAVPRPLQPKDIARWQSRLEFKITETLQDLSHTTNRVLQKANILPNRLPEPVLEVATKADLSSESTASPPNLLNLLIEADSDQDKPTMTQVMAVRLRLSELEFGDATTAAHRSQLRQLMAQLSKWGREYQRKQKEYAIAQAETAWRSSWFEGD